MPLGFLAAAAAFAVALLLWLLAAVFEALLIDHLTSENPTVQLQEDIELLKAEELRIKRELAQLRSEIDDAQLLAEIDAALAR